MSTFRTASPPEPVVVSTFWTWVALLLALVGVAGTLYLSLGLELEVGLDLIPCPLCFYQRTLVMAIAAVLLMGLFGGPRRSGFLSAVTMPLTVAALGIAGFHVYIELNGDLKCPDGAIPAIYKEVQGEDTLYKQMQGIVTPPKESAALLFLLFVAQFIDIARSSSRGGFGIGAVAGAIILGGLICVGALATAGPGKIPQWPAELKGCRKPHKP
jgi:hypothetical protein